MLGRHLAVSAERWALVMSARAKGPALAPWIPLVQREVIRLAVTLTPLFCISRQAWVTLTMARG